MQHLVTIVCRPAPESIRPGHQDQAAALLQLWEEHMDMPSRGNGDYEDHFEQAARLQAAIGSFGPDNIWLHRGGCGSSTARNLGTGETLPVSTLDHLPVFGLQAGQIGGSMLSATPDQKQERLASRYASYNAFQQRAGRQSIIAGYDTQDEQDLEKVLWDLYQAGVRHFFVKTNVTKLALWEFEADDGLKSSDLQSLLLDIADWTIVRRHGDRNFLQVQAAVTMHYEYRLFVINGQLVTGAGCIEEHCPLDNRGADFDPQARKRRNSEDPIDTLQLSNYLDFAQEVIHALSMEVPDLHSYVLDVATGADGWPLIVEPNGHLNAGLYANKPGLITDALATKSSIDNRRRHRALSTAYACRSIAEG